MKWILWYFVILERNPKLILPKVGPATGLVWASPADVFATFFCSGVCPSSPGEKKAAQMRKAGGEKMGRKWFTKCLQVCVFLETAWIQQVSFKKMKNEKMRFQPRFNMFQGTGPVASMAALASFGLQHMALSQLGNARSTKAAPATASAASVVDGLVSAGTRAAELCAADYVRAARHMTFQHCANIANSSISSLKIVEFLKYILLNPAFQLGRACDSFNERG